MNKTLTVILTFHKEGHLARAALRSTLEACQQAEIHGISCKIAVVIDRGDSYTREHILNFKDRISCIHEVAFGDVSKARNYAISRVDTFFIATLDGDDLFSADWLWKGVEHLQKIGKEKVVGHAQIRMTFGSDLFGLVQIPSDSYLFHPLGLISTWPYAADIIAPAEIFKQFPYKPNEISKGFGGEDWHWNCESLMQSIEHVIVPQTSYFYRRQANHLSLGMEPHKTFPPTKLFEKASLPDLLERYPLPAAPIMSPDTPTGRGSAERWETVPQWLKKDVERVCGIDLAVYSLYLDLAKVPIQTPDYHPNTITCFLELMAMIKLGKINIVIFFDDPDADDISLVDVFLHHCRNVGGNQINVCLINLSPSAGHDYSRTLNSYHKDSDITYLRLCGATPFHKLSDNLQHDVIIRFLLQSKPRMMINLESSLIDDCIGNLGRAIGSVVPDVVRVCRGEKIPLLDRRFHAQWHGLERARALYSHAICENRRVARWLQSYFRGCSLRVLSCGAETSSQKNFLLATFLFRLLGEDENAPDTGRTSPSFLQLAESRVLDPPVQADSKSIDVSCIVTVNCEGHYFNQTLQCIVKQIQEAERHGITTEFIIVSDSPGEITSGIVADLCLSNIDIIPLSVDYNHFPSAFQAGIDVSRGQFIALFSGTDLVSTPWLLKALTKAKSGGETTIYHPELQVESGLVKDVRIQPESSSISYHPQRLAINRVWHPCVLARRSVFELVPYQSTPAESGYDDSCWHWNCETVLAEFSHQTVENTAVYLRSDCADGDRGAQLGKIQEKTLAPSLFFDPDNSSLNKTKRWTKKILGFLGEYKEVDRLSKSHTLLDKDKLILSRWDPSFLLSYYITPTVRGLMLMNAVSALSFPVGLIHRSIYAVLGKDTSVINPTANIENGAKRLFKILGTQKARYWLDEELNSERSKRYREQYQNLDKKSNALYTLTRNLSEINPTHLFITPSLRIGGAEQSMLFTIEALLKNEKNRIVIINTDDTDNRWLKTAKLPERCHCELFGHLTRDLEFEDQVTILTRFLMNTQARCLHLMYSWLGWQALTRYIKPLSRKLKIFVSLFDVPPVTARSDSGYAAFLGPLLSELSGIFTDNMRAAEALRSYYGVSEKKITVLHHPVSVSDRSQSDLCDPPVVLWAGRVDYDKRPDLLIQIAKCLPDIKFHVHGSNILGNDHFVQALKKITNIEYKGIYKGFDTIPHACYTAYLHTAYWEGLPNTLLEAMGSGLLAIAPDVGGIREVIGEDRGRLIKYHTPPHEYVRALKTILDDPATYQKMARNGQNYVKGLFNWDVFVAEIKSNSEYFNGKRL